MIKIGIAYRWSFPFNLSVFKSRMIVVKTLQQAKQFEAELDKDHVEVEVLNATPEEGGPQTQKRISNIQSKEGTPYIDKMDGKGIK